MAQPARQQFSFREYLHIEENSAVKHEFLDGHVWAMAGGSPDHAAIAANITAALVAQVRDKPCRVYSSDLRLRIRATGLGTYADVTVICGRFEADPDDPKGHTALNPIVVIEVLSPSTEVYDRGEKRQHYEQIASLQEIVLVAHDRRAVEVWRRDGNGGWMRDEYDGDASVRLESIGAQLSVRDVYRNPLSG